MSLADAEYPCPITDKGCYTASKCREEGYCELRLASDPSWEPGYRVRERRERELTKAAEDALAAWRGGRGHGGRP